MANRDREHWLDESMPKEDPVEEERMRAALRRVPAPQGFTERVMARAAPQAGAPARAPGGGSKRLGALLPWPRTAWRYASAAAAVLAVGSGALHLQHRRTEQYRRAEQRRAAVAAAQFDTALAVTDHALDRIRVKLAATEVGALERALEQNGGGQ